MERDHRIPSCKKLQWPYCRISSLSRQPNHEYSALTPIPSDINRLPQATNPTMRTSAPSLRPSPTLSSIAHMPPAQAIIGTVKTRFCRASAQVSVYGLKFPSLACLANRADLPIPLPPPGGPSICTQPPRRRQPGCSSGCR
jgi:hypothetical protein